jgi:hypothetical protein
MRPRLLVKPFMKRFIILTSTTLLLFFGCDSKFIDDIFTFNVEKSFEFTIPAGTPAGVTAPAVSLPLFINDSVLQAHGTSMSLLKAAKLTKLNVVFSEPSFTLSDIDTLDFRISSTNHAMTSLAYYSTGMDTIRLTNVDFAPIIKDNGAAVSAVFRLKTSPAQDIKTTVNYTIAITAHPF